MTPQDQLLCLLTRQLFQEKHQKAVLDLCSHHSIPWDVVYITAREHGVAPLIHMNLIRCGGMTLGISQPLWTTSELLLAANQLRKRRQAEKIVQLVSRFRQRSIDVMLVKGVALDCVVYAQPWYTISGDVDLV